MGFLLFYMLACIFHFVVMILYVLENIWDRIEEEGLKVKDVLNLIFFLPSWLLIGLLILLLSILYFIMDSKFWQKLNQFLNKTIWKRKIQ
jgi:hypothetical protein